MMGKYLKGGKAEYAGESMQDQPRKFGVIYPSNFNIEFFKPQLKKQGLKLASKAGVHRAAAASVGLRTIVAEIAEQLPTLDHQAQERRRQQPHHDGLARRRDHGDEGDEGQEWFPEMVVTSYPYTDLDILARSFDQEVWSHAFGLVWFLPYVDGADRRLSRDVPVVLGHGSGHEVGGRRAPTSAVSTRASTSPDRTSPRRPSKSRFRGEEANAGVGGEYSEEHVDVRSASPCPTGGITVRGAALGLVEPGRAPDPATSTSAARARVSTCT